MQAWHEQAPMRNINPWGRTTVSFRSCRDLRLLSTPARRYKPTASQPCMQEAACAGVYGRTLLLLLCRAPTTLLQSDSKSRLHIAQCAGMDGRALRVCFCDGQPALQPAQVAAIVGANRRPPAARMRLFHQPESCFRQRIPPWYLRSSGLQLALVVHTNVSTR